MFACWAVWDVDRGMLGELEMLSTAVSWDELITEISLTSRDNTGVEGSDAGEDDILASVNKSVICTSTFSIVLTSVRPSDEVSLAD